MFIAALEIVMRLFAAPATFPIRYYQCPISKRTVLLSVQLILRERYLERPVLGSGASVLEVPTWLCTAR